MVGRRRGQRVPCWGQVVIHVLAVDCPPVWRLAGSSPSVEVGAWRCYASRDWKLALGGEIVWWLGYEVHIWEMLWLQFFADRLPGEKGPDDQR
jgi:hypothetical protein